MTPHDHRRRDAKEGGGGLVVSMRINLTRPSFDWTTPTPKHHTRKLNTIQDFPTLKMTKFESTLMVSPLSLYVEGPLFTQNRTGLLSQIRPPSDITKRQMNSAAMFGNLSHLLPCAMLPK